SRTQQAAKQSTTQRAAMNPSANEWAYESVQALDGRARNRELCRLKLDSWLGTQHSRLWGMRERRQSGWPLAAAHATAPQPEHQSRMPIYGKMRLGMGASGTPHDARHCKRVRTHSRLGRGLCKPCCCRLGRAPEQHPALAPLAHTGFSIRTATRFSC